MEFTDSELAQLADVMEAYTAKKELVALFSKEAFEEWCAGSREDSEYAQVVSFLQQVTYAFPEAEKELEN